MSLKVIARSKATMTLFFPIASAQGSLSKRIILSSELMFGICKSYIYDKWVLNMPDILYRLKKSEIILEK